MPHASNTSVTRCASMLLLSTMALMAGCGDPATDPVIRPTATGALAIDVTVVPLPEGLGDHPVFAGALGNTLVGGASGLYALVDDHFELRDAQPVRALTYLDGLGFVVLGTQSLGIWDGYLLRPSTLNDSVRAADIHSLAVRGDELWFSTATEVARIVGTEREQFAESAGTAIISYRAARDLLLVAATGLTVLREADGAWTRQSLDDEAPLSLAVPSSGFRILAVGRDDGALLERFVDAGRAQYRPVAMTSALSDRGLVGVEALLTDPERGDTWAVTASELHLISSSRIDSAARPTELTRVDGATPTADGALWTLTDDGKAARLRATHTISFAAEIAPLSQRHCLRCHRTGGVAATTLETAAQWQDNFDRIVELITSREMPRDQATTVTSTELELIVNWQATGFGE